MRMSLSGDDMHGKIIEVSKIALKPDEWVDESEFYKGFVGWIADYVDTDLITEDIRNGIIEAFLRNFGSFTENHDNNISFVVHDGFKEKYEKQRIEYMRDAVASADTAAEIYSAFYMYFEDMFGLYIYEKGYGLIPMVRWIIEYLEEDCTYYFGSVIDYHW